ncbi:hypothetical protein TNCV_3167991 [Trichonephila clavipes]|uniref:Uncharacterized protein n=1 Tax=Trichonephila clavipes TaxID=2585209 RepID=A0A8X6R9L1_TRICX|nr:hypothetical protein TNCV_3167991 [Trichonephila clavipes]
MVANIAMELVPAADSDVNVSISATTRAEHVCLRLDRPNLTQPSSYQVLSNRRTNFMKSATVKGPSPVFTFFRRRNLRSATVVDSSFCGSHARIRSQSSRHCWRSPLPHASSLFQREFGCVLGVQQTKKLPHVAKVDLVWPLGVYSGSIIEQPWTTCILSAKDPESEPASEAKQSGD